MDTSKKTIITCVCAVLALLLIATAIVAGCEQQPPSNSPSTRPGNHEPSDPTRPGNTPSDPSDEPTKDPFKDTSGNPDSDNTSDTPSQPEIEYAVWDGSIADGFAGGDGTEGSPYEIADGAQLAYLARQVANENTAYSGEGVHYILTDNIDLNNLEWCPIGTGVDLSGSYSDDAIFRGVFDGNDKHITNVRIQDFKSYHNYFGLFGYVDRATIRNLTIDYLNYSGTFVKANYRSDYVGGLVSYAYSSVIENCFIQSGSISANGASCIGGIAGDLSNCTVRNCHVTATIYGNISCYCGGGFTGSFSGTISDCTANSVLHFESCGGDIGGFVGAIYSGDPSLGSVTTVSYSSATGSVYCDIEEGEVNAGGFAGHVGGRYSIITDCFSTGAVTVTYPGNRFSKARAAGFACYVTEDNALYRCISFGNVRGGDVAGFCRSTTSPLNSCVAFGSVISDSDYASNSIPFCSGKDDKLIHCYRPENQVVHPGAGNNQGTARYFEDMNKPEFFDFDPLFAAGWDFTGFNVLENVYPSFLSQKERENNSIAISSVDDLLKVRDSFASAYLTNDLDFSDITEWTAINFHGVLDGNGYAICNPPAGYVFYINEGTIKNLNIGQITLEGEDPFFTGLIYDNRGHIDNCSITDLCVGNISEYANDLRFCLVENNRGTVAHCSSNVTIAVEKTYHGLSPTIMFIDTNTGTISQCSSVIYFCDTASFTANGIANWNYGIIEQCNVEATGTIQDSFSFGGIVNENKSNASITNCYVNCNAAVNIENISDRHNAYLYWGGIAISSEGSISNCVATSEVLGNNIGTTVNRYETAKATVNIGGIVGSVSNQGKIENCLAETIITANVYAKNLGGKAEKSCFVGYIAGEGGNIDNCYFSDTSSINITGVEPMIMNGGQEISANSLNDESFYFDTLNFSKDIWSFSEEWGDISLK